MKAYYISPDLRYIAFQFYAEKIVNFLISHLLFLYIQLYNATSQQVALSWLYHHKPNILLIPGTSKVRHVKENVNAADIVLSAKEMDELSNV